MVEFCKVDPVACMIGLFITNQRMERIALPHDGILIRQDLIFRDSGYELFQVERFKISGVYKYSSRKAFRLESSRCRMYIFDEQGIGVGNHGLTFCRSVSEECYFPLLKEGSIGFFIHDIAEVSLTTCIETS